MSKPQVLILAGGGAKRMRPLEVCKSLISFAGRPLIKYIIDDWRHAGIGNFKIVCAPEYLQKIKTSLNDNRYQFFVQKKPLGMADGVLSAKIDENKPLIIINGEDLLESGTGIDFLKKAKKTKGEVLLTGLYLKKYFPGGYFKLKEKEITGLIEKPEQGKEPSRFVNIVLHYFKDPSLFLKYLKNTKTIKDDAYEAALDMMIKDKIKAELFDYHGYWQSLKYPWHILDMMAMIFKHRWQIKTAKMAEISPKATIKGKVIIEDGVKIYEGACISGPVYLGKNTVVGNNALVRESMIGENCVVGFNSEIARSWIGDNCWFHANYIGDSVLQDNVSFGSGAVTANLRLDEKEIAIKREKEKIMTERNKLGAIIGRDVRVGVNASLMPGMVIGQNALVGPNVVLYENLPQNKACFLQKNCLEIRNYCGRIASREKIYGQF